MVTRTVEMGPWDSLLKSLCGIRKESQPSVLANQFLADISTVVGSVGTALMSIGVGSTHLDLILKQNTNQKINKYWNVLCGIHKETNSSELSGRENVFEILKRSLQWMLSMDH